MRSHNEKEAQLLRQENVGMVLMGEQELARNMAKYIFDELKPANH